MNDQTERMASNNDQRPTLGMIGLGRMGANLVRRAHAHGFSCVGYDPDATAGQPLAADGVAEVVADLPAFVAAQMVINIGMNLGRCAGAGHMIWYGNRGIHLRTSC